MLERHRRYFEEALSGDPTAIARLLVSTPSVNPVLSPGGDGEGKIADVVAGLLEAWGLPPRVHEFAPGRFNVVAALEGLGPTLLLNGHLDTVGVEGMTVPPFDAEIVASRLAGRGSSDMKAGVAALLAATRRLALGGPRPNLLVALTGDEEHASLGMQALVQEGVFADLAVVCEPTELAVMPAHKGFVWVRAAFEGRSAHGSIPAEGVDAIRHAAIFVAALDRYTEELERRPGHALLGHGSIHAGTIAGGTVPSVYPEYCEVQLECRTMPDQSAVSVLADLKALLDRVRGTETRLRGTLEITLERPGTEVPLDSEVVTGLLAACDARGLPASVGGMTAWVDAAFLNLAGIPAVCFGPGSMARAHTADEWVDVRQIGACADVLETFARALASP